MPLYSYVIAIVLKSTCEENIECADHYEPEIIEFAAALINLGTGQNDIIFHKYIKPAENILQIPCCTQLNAPISKYEDSDITLSIALNMFKELVRKGLKLAFANDRCGFVTWTDWTLKTCLLRECERKGLSFPDFFKKWIDLSSVHRRIYLCPPKSLRDALEDVGVGYESKKNSTTDNATNLVRLAYKLDQHVNLSITSKI